MADIDLNLVANVESSLKQIENFSKASTKSLEGVEGSFKHLEQSAKEFAENSSKSASGFESALNALKVAGGLLLTVFAGHKIKEFFDEAKAAAISQEDSIQTLNAALAVNGDFTQQASENFIEFADALEKSTGFSDGQALKLVALAKSFGATNEQAEKIVKTAVDFSAITKDSVDASVTQLSATLNGFGKGVSKVVGDVKNLTKEQLIAGDAIDLVSKRFDGAAEALGNTFSGAATKAGNAFEEILKATGQLIVKNPIFIGLLKNQTQSYQGLAEKVLDSRDAVIEFSVSLFENFGKAAASVIRSLGFLGDAIEGIEVVIKGLAVALASMAEIGVKSANSIISGFSRISATVFIPLIEAVSQTAKALNTIGAVSDDTVSTLDDISKATLAIAANGTDVLGSLSDDVTAFKNAAVQSFQDTRDSAGETRLAYVAAADSTQEYFTNIVKLGKEALNNNSIFEKLNSTAVKGTKDFEDQKKAIEDLTKSFAELQKDLQKAADERDPLAGVAREEQERLQIIEDSLRAGLVKEQEAADIRNQINLTAAEKTIKAIEKLDEERIDKLKKLASEGIASPLITPIQAGVLTGGSEGVSGANASDIGQITGLISSVLKGAEGASKLIQSAVGTIADSLIPGIGGAIGDIVGVLAQGPEKAGQFVEQFAKAIPDVIKNIGLAIPVVVQTLADNLDEIIIGLVRATPQIIKALVKAAPEIAKALAIEVPRELVGALVDEVRKQFSIADISENFRNAVNNTADTVKGAGASFSDRAKSAGGDFSDRAKSAGANLSEGAKGFASQVGLAGGQIAEQFRAIPEKLKEALGKITEFDVKIIEAAKNFLANLLTGLKEGLSNLIGGLSLKLPEFKFPSFPEFKFPSLPAFKFPELPKFTFPALPTFKFPALPEFHFPKLPSLNIEIPPIQLPSFDINIPGLDKITSGAKSIIPKFSLPKFARGGEVPEGFPNDSFPLLSSSGENVIDRSLSEKLDRFLSSDTQSKGGAPVKVVLQVGEKQLADVLLNINRQGFRTA